MFRLTDGDISEIARRGCLEALEQIHITGGFTILLSEISIYKLLDTCPR